LLGNRIFAQVKQKNYTKLFIFERAGEGTIVRVANKSGTIVCERQNHHRQLTQKGTRPQGSATSALWPHENLKITLDDTMAVSVPVEFCSSDEMFGH
jgi:hypothetical protein